MENIFLPQLSRTGHEKFVFHGVKFYRGAFRRGGWMRCTLAQFKTATLAEEYAQAVMERYAYLLEAAPTPLPAASPQMEEHNLGGEGDVESANAA